MARRRRPALALQEVPAPPRRQLGAAELAHHLRLPCPRVELAQDREGTPGVAVLDFREDPREVLIHGNQLLATRHVGYPIDAVRRIDGYTVERVLDALRDPQLHVPRISPELAPAITRPGQLLVGYLLLDAWIGNTDRHHEKWGLLERGEVRTLAPTYDHASSLGRELTDRRRRIMLTTRDPQQRPETYAASAVSPFHAEGDASRRLSPIAAFHRALPIEPEAAAVWVARLRASHAEAARILTRIRGAMISEPARELAARLLICNSEAILANFQESCSS